MGGDAIRPADVAQSRRPLTWSWLPAAPRRGEGPRETCCERSVI